MVITRRNPPPASCIIGWRDGGILANGANDKRPAAGLGDDRTWCVSAGFRRGSSEPRGDTKRAELLEAVHATWRNGIGSIGSAWPAQG